MRELLDGEEGFMVERLNRPSFKDLPQEHVAEGGRELIEVSEVFVRDGYTYKPFGSKMKPEFAVFVEGVDDLAAKYCNLLAISLDPDHPVNTVPHLMNDPLKKPV